MLLLISWLGTSLHLGQKIYFSDTSLSVEDMVNIGAIAASCATLLLNIPCMSNPNRNWTETVQKDRGWGVSAFEGGNDLTPPRIA